MIPSIIQHVFAQDSTTLHDYQYNCDDLHELLSACISICKLWWCSFLPQSSWHHIQYIPRNMHTVTALLCFFVVIHWLIFPYPSGLLHWHCGNLTIAPVPAKQPWWIWINTSCEFIMNDCITTTKQSTTKPCAYFLGYTVWQTQWCDMMVTLYMKSRYIKIYFLQNESNSGFKFCVYAFYYHF